MVYSAVKFDVRPGIANLYHVYVPWQLRQSFLLFDRFFEMRMPRRASDSTIIHCSNTDRKSVV